MYPYVKLTFSIYIYGIVYIIVGLGFNRGMFCSVMLFFNNYFRYISLAMSIHI